MSTALQRILIVAENASTHFGGEAILPYHYFRLLRARGYDVHLVVHERTREELETLFPDDRDHLHFIPDRGLQKLFFRLGGLVPSRINDATFGLANQLLTQFGQRAVVRRLVVPGCVLHQPIPVSPRFPSLLYNLGAPLVCGPLNGGMEYPAKFAQTQSKLSAWTLRLGRGFTNIVNTWLPGKRRAAIVLVANGRTRAALPSGLQGRVEWLVENGVDTAQWTVQKTEPRNGHFIFVGRFVDWKALDIVIDALAQVPNATLEIVGDGNMLATWKMRAHRLGVTDRIVWRGWLSQAECAAAIAASTALVLPSLYECGGAVVLEAMAMARPVIATHWGGPADYLDETCGILLEPAGREALVAGFAHAMRALLSDPHHANALGRAGRVRVMTHFDWQRKMDAIIAIYQRALAT